MINRSTPDGGPHNPGSDEEFVHANAAIFAQYTKQHEAALAPVRNQYTADNARQVLKALGAKVTPEALSQIHDQAPPPKE